MRTLLTLFTCLAVLTCGLLNSANAQSAEDLRKWAEQARERMNQEFERQRQRIDDLRKQLNEELDKLMNGGETDSAPSAPAAGASLGITAGDIDDGMRTLLEIPEGQGVLVKEVAEDSPAAKTLKTWDVILTVDGKNVGSPADIGNALKGKKAGEKVTLVILRESAKQTVTVELTAGAGGASSDSGDLEGFLNDSFEEGDKPDPQAEEGSPFQNPFGGGNNPFGEGNNPFGGGEGMQQLQERMQELFQNPERLQQMMEQFREMMQGRNPQNPNGGEGQNPLGGGLEDFLRGLEGGGNQGEPQGEATPAPVQRPWIGISGVNPNDEMQAAGATGVVVTRVTEGGPAAGAGLQRGDIIVAIGDQKISNRDDLKLAIDKMKVGETVKVTFKRGEETKTAEMVVASR